MFLAKKILWCFIYNIMLNISMKRTLFVINECNIYFFLFSICNNNKSPPFCVYFVLIYCFKKKNLFFRKIINYIVFNKKQRLKTVSNSAFFAFYSNILLWIAMLNALKKNELFFAFYLIFLLWNHVFFYIAIVLMSFFSYIFFFWFYFCSFTCFFF